MTHLQSAVHLQQTLADVREELEQVRTQRNVARNELETLRRSTARDHELLEGRLNEALYRCDQLRGFQQVAKAAEEKLADAVERTQTLEHELETLNQALQHANEYRQSLENQRDSLQKHVELQRIEFHKQLEERELANQQLRESLDEAQRANHQLTVDADERRRLESVLDQAEDMLTRTTTERDELLREREKLLEELGLLQQKHQQLSNSIEADLAQATAAVQELERRNDELGDQCGDLKRKLADSQSELRRMSAECDEAEHQHVRMAGELETARSERETLLQDYRRLETKLAAQHQLDEQLKISLRELREENEALRARDADRHSAEQKLRALAAELSASQEQADQAAAQIEELQRENAALVEQLDQPVARRPQATRSGKNVVTDLKHVFTRIQGNNDRRRPIARRTAS